MDLSTNIDKWIKRAAHKAPEVGSIIRVLDGSEVRLARVIEARYVGYGRIKMGVEWLDEPPVLRVAA